MSLSGGIVMAGLHWVTQCMTLPAYAAGGLHVAGAAEPDPHRRSQASASQMVPTPLVHDWRELLGRDGVSVLDCAFGHRASRQEARLEVIEAAAKHGHAVMLQKPLAGSLAVAEQLVSRARELGVVAAVNHNARYNPAAYSVKGLLDPDRLGQPRVIELTSHWRGDIREVDLQWPASTSHTVHHADMMRWWVGRPCIKVYAQARDAVTLATYTFDDGTIANHVEHHSGPTCHQVRFRVLAEHGLIEGGHNWNWHLPSAAGEDFVGYYPDTSRPRIDLALPTHIYRPPWSDINPYLPHDGPWYDLAAPVAGMLGTMAELLDATACEREPSISLEVSLESLRMAHAAVHSARRGVPVDPRELAPDPTVAC
jgi:predicted dehydrogenase